MGALIDNTTGAIIPEQTKTNIALLNKVSQGLKDLQEQHTSVPDCSTDEGYAEAKTLAKQVAKVRIDTDKAHKGAKEFYLEGGRSIDKMKNQILDVVKPIEDGYKQAIKAVDDEKARIEQEAKEREEARIAAIQAHLERIKMMPPNAITLDQVAKSITELNDVELAEFAEFSVEAEQIITQSLSDLIDKRKALEAQAEEAERLEKQRLEQERQSAEIQKQKDELAAEQKKLDDAKRAEEQRQAVAEAQRKAQEKADREKKEAAELAEKRRVEEAERAEREKAEAVEHARLTAIEDERRRIEKEELLQAEKEAEKARLAALKPDTEQLSVWVSKLYSLNKEMPSMSTPEGKKTTDDIGKLIKKIEVRADQLFDSQEAA